MKMPWIGMRAVKTAIAVFAALWVCHRLLPAGAVYAAIAAVICMQQTSDESLRKGIERMVATTIGSLTGFLVIKFAAGLPYYQEILYLIIIPIGTLVAIYISLLIDKQMSVILSAVVFLAITTDLSRGVTDVESYVAVRYFGTLAGILVSGLVNHLICPYRAENSALSEHEDTDEEKRGQR